MELSQLRKDFEFFRDDAAWCRIVFNTHQTLFAGGKETSQLLSQSAGSFFLDYSAISQEYHHLLVARLTDPARSGSNENLTAAQLVERLNDAELLTQEISRLSDLLMQYRQRVRNSRNKQIAHRDLTTLRAGKKAESWPVQEVEEFHRNLNSFCDEFAIAIELEPLDFSTTASRGDARDLIRILQRAQNT